LGAICGGIYFAFAPRIYQGTTQILISPEIRQGGQGPVDDITQILRQAETGNTVSELMILRGQATFREALRRVADDRGDQTIATRENAERMFMMYDVLGARDSRVAQIEVKAADPGIAAEVANKVVEVYNGLREQTGQEAIASAEQALQQQIRDAQVALNRNEAAFRDFKARRGIADINIEATEAAGYRSRLVADRDQAQGQIAEFQRRIDLNVAEIRRLPQTRETSSSQVRNPEADQIQQELTRLENQRSELLRTFTENSKRVSEVNVQIEQTRRRFAEAERKGFQTAQRTVQVDPVRSSLESQVANDRASLAAAQARFAAASAALTRQQAIVQQLPETQRQFTGLASDVAILRDRLTRLKIQLEDLRAKKIAGYRQAQVLFIAQPTDVPVSPIISRVLAVSIIAGAALFLLGSLIRESFRNTVRTSTELTDLMGLPVAATAPILSPRQVQQRLRSIHSRKFQPQESFRFMASSVLLTNGERPKRVLFTSVGGSVGCSSSSSEFAIAASKMGLKVTLIDADLKFCTVSRAFQVSDKSGLRDIINRTMLPTPDAELHLPTEHQGLSVLPAGSPEGDGISDVPISELSGILDHLQESAEMLVIDCPPCDVLADASRFVPFVDQVCLVVSARKTNYRLIMMAENLLKRAGAKKVSLILTGTTPEEEAFSRMSRYTLAPR
jgi:Mrp family chromosome partitioning ATPase/uncharacterized protein involved in exopolysaccharide biosynthesis